MITLTPENMELIPSTTDEITLPSGRRNLTRLAAAFAERIDTGDQSVVVAVIERLPAKQADELVDEFMNTRKPLYATIVKLGIILCQQPVLHSLTRDRTFRAAWDNLEPVVSHIEIPVPGMSGRSITIPCLRPGKHEEGWKLKVVNAIYRARAWSLAGSLDELTKARNDLHIALFEMPLSESPIDPNHLRPEMQAFLKEQPRLIPMVCESLRAYATYPKAKSPDDIDMPERYIKTAIETNCLELVELVLQRYHHLVFPDDLLAWTVSLRQGETSRFYPDKVIEPHDEMIKLLFKNGFLPDIPTKNGGRYQKDQPGSTAAFRLIFHNAKATMAWLLRNGCNQSVFLKEVQRPEGLYRVLSAMDPQKNIPNDKGVTFDPNSNVPMECPRANGSKEPVGWLNWALDHHIAAGQLSGFEIAEIGRLIRLGAETPIKLKDTGPASIERLVRYRKNVLETMREAFCPQTYRTTSPRLRSL